MKPCRRLTAILWAALLFPGAGQAADSITPDLKAAADGRGWKKLGNLELRWVADAKGKPALRVKPAGEGGVLLVEGLEFGNGEIEFDCLGQSGPRQSNFLGIAFRAVDAKTHDAVLWVDVK